MRRNGYLGASGQKSDPVIRSSHAWLTYQFWSSHDYRLPTCELLNLITFPLSRTLTAHATSHVTYHRGEGIIGPHFWNPWPQFTYSLCHYDEK